jgi:hypothetical protein
MFAQSARLSEGVHGDAFDAARPGRFEAMPSKWDDYWILAIHRNPGWFDRLLGIDPIKEAAMRYRRRCNAPANHCFYHGAPIPGFGQLYQGSLGHVTLTDKLIIVSHGDRTRIDALTYDEFGDLLQNAGLTRCGLLAIKACQVGAGDYLNNLSVSLTGFIQIGWLVGYKHSVITRSGGHEATGFIDYVLQVFGGKLSDNHRVRVQRGNTYLGTNIGRRYTYA